MYCVYSLLSAGEYRHGLDSDFFFKCTNAICCHYYYHIISHSRFFGLKISSLPTFALKSRNECSYSTSRAELIHALVLRESYPFYHHFYL
jgi:hypothetical protein